MEGPGQKLKRVRERLNLRFRDVEIASAKIAERHRNDEYVLGLSRLADIENKGTVPSIYRMYSLAAIYRLDPCEVMTWYGIDFGSLAADSALMKLERTHPVSFPVTGHGAINLPLTLDPGIDLKRTTFLSLMIQRWGRLPLILLDKLNIEEHLYGYVGSDDWFMYPLIHPGSLLLIDDTKRKIQSSGWTTEFDRPIYFVEHRTGYYCAWCMENSDGNVVLQPHPASQSNPVFYEAGDIDVIGQVTGVAMRLDQGKKRRARS
jgi:hypothetical protein